jgi:hypothetical protein
MIEIETRPISGFDRITLRGYGDMLLEQGESEAITIETSKDMLERIVTEVKNGELVISFKNWLDILFNHQPIQYRISLINLKGLAISGTSKVRAEHLKGDTLKLGVSGSGEVTISDLDYEALDAHTSGSAKWRLAGKVVRQEVAISGSGRYYAEELDSQQAVVRVSGSGHLALKVQQTLEISISGAGEVSYIGDPQVKQSISGAGKVWKVTSK